LISSKSTNENDDGWRVSAGSDGSAQKEAGEQIGSPAFLMALRN
jgi:hypothetical protein